MKAQNASENSGLITTAELALGPRAVENGGIERSRRPY
jgi:hypothetical protein